MAAVSVHLLEQHVLEERQINVIGCGDAVIRSLPQERLVDVHPLSSLPTVGRHRSGSVAATFRPSPEERRSVGHLCCYPESALVPPISRRHSGSADRSSLAHPTAL